MAKNGEAKAASEEEAKRSETALTQPAAERNDVAKRTTRKVFQKSGLVPRWQIMAAERQLLSRTSVEAYDKLAQDSPAELQAVLSEAQENGWIIKATAKLPADTPAQFFPRKGRFYYNPDRMTVLDMLHEQKHLALFKQRGNWKIGGSQIWRDELEAYTFEHELGKQQGFSKEYMEYLENRIEYYKGKLAP